MKYLVYVLIALFSMFTQSSSGQAIKTNIPLTLAGSPNLGFEFTVGNQMAINVEGLWTPYMSKSSESVFRVLQTSADLRYYLKPKYYHTNNMFDGFYVGPYVMYGNYNVGFNRADPVESNDRYVGWALSAGVNVGYKLYLSRRFRLDFNLGIGYAHLQHDIYRLGKEYSEYPYKIKDTKSWIGPTKFGIHLVYNINRK